MKNALVITGTDTDIGKTVVSAAICAALDIPYWKPVQSGMEDATDSDRLRALGAKTILPEAYKFALPASPHISAAAEGREITPATLALPLGPVVIEGAGGLMVPLTPDDLLIDLFASWRAPVILCARTALGTINHSLLSLEALRARLCPILGVVFIGDAAPEVEDSIIRFGKTRHLGRMPFLDPLNSTTLSQAAHRHLDLATIKQALT